MLWIAACSAALSALVLVLCFVAPSLATHRAVAVAMPLLATAMLLALVVHPLARPLPPRNLARAAERRFPDLQDALLAVVDPAHAAGAGASRPLAGALARDVGIRLGGKRPLQSLNWRGIRALCIAALTCVLTALLIVTTCPEGVARLVSPPPVDATPSSPSRAKTHAPRPASVGLFDLRLQVNPPEYTALPTRHITEEFHVLRLIKGTRVTLRARQSKDARATLSLTGETAIPLTPDAGALAHEFTIVQDCSWNLTVRKRDKEASVGPHRIVAVADARPRVKITQPGRDLTLDSLRPIRLLVEARDDFGLAGLSLLYRRQGETAWRALPIAGAGRTVNAASSWDLSPMGLRPGDALEYRAVARDRDTISGPKSTSTRTYTVSLRGVTPAPPTPEAIESAQELTHDSLEKLRAEAQAFDRLLQQLVANAHAAETSGDAPATSRAALQEAQQRLSKRAEDVRNAMTAAHESLAQSPLVSEDMVQKVQELHKLMAELMDDDLAKIMAKIQEAMKQLGTREFRMTLEEARQAQREFMDKLDRTISLMRKAKLEAQLEALRTFIEQLARRQEDLRDRTAELQEGERASENEREQDALAKQAAPLPDQIRKISREMIPESEEIASDLRNLATNLEDQDAGAEMRQAADAMRRATPSRAGAPQRRALAALQDAAAGLSAAAADLTAQDRRALTNAAHRLTRDALKLSQTQETVIKKTRRLVAQGQVDLIEHKPQLSDLKRRQDAVRKGVDGLASQMRNLAGRTAIMDPDLTQQAESLARSMGRSADEIDAGRVAIAFGRQTQAMVGLNELAAELMQLAEQMNAQSARMALDEHMKRLQELAQRQKGLNQRTGGDNPGAQGSPQRQAGAGKPGPGAGDLGQLALEQALIREALRKMLSGKGTGKLGDQLGGVPADMQKIEDDLRGGRVTQETLRRQRDILHKMLDAQRSLYSKKKQSKERKAEAPKPYEPPKDPPILRADQSRPPAIDRQRIDPGTHELPLDFELLAEEYLQRISR